MTYFSNALCAKAKAIYGQRIEQELYSELSRKQSIVDAVNVLKSSGPYVEAFQSMNRLNVNRHIVEQALQKEYYKKMASLLRYIPSKHQSFYYHEMTKVEIEVILDKILHLLSGDDQGLGMEIPDYLSSKVTFNMFELINIHSYQALVKFLEKTKYYELLQKYDVKDMSDFNHLEKELLEYYYTSLVQIVKKQFKGKTQKQLLDIIYTSIELKNFEKIYRLKKYFNASNIQIMEIVSLQYSRLSRQDLMQLIESKDSEHFLQLLSKSKYQYYSDQDEFKYIEYHVEKIKYNIAKRYMRFSNEAPLVYLTICILQQIEVDNLKHIVEGLRYQRAPHEIEEMLIYT